LNLFSEISVNQLFYKGKENIDLESLAKATGFSVDYLREKLELEMDTSTISLQDLKKKTIKLIQNI